MLARRNSSLCGRSRPVRLPARQNCRGIRLRRNAPERYLAGSRKRGIPCACPPVRLLRIGARSVRTDRLTYARPQDPPSFGAPRRASKSARLSLALLSSHANYGDGDGSVQREGPFSFRSPPRCSLRGTSVPSPQFRATRRSAAALTVSTAVVSQRCRFAWTLRTGRFCVRIFRLGLLKFMRPWYLSGAVWNRPCAALPLVIHTYALRWPRGRGCSSNGWHGIAGPPGGALFPRRGTVREITTQPLQPPTQSDSPRLTQPSEVDSLALSKGFVCGGHLRSKASTLDFANVFRWARYFGSSVSNLRAATHIGTHNSSRLAPAYPFEQ